MNKTLNNDEESIQKHCEESKQDRTPNTNNWKGLRL